MAQIKLTKNELRGQQKKLVQLEKYLPTLQLKKALLQAEIQQAAIEIEKCKKAEESITEKVSTSSSLLTDHFVFPIDTAVHVRKIHKRHENIAGVEVPLFASLEFEPVEYDLFDTQPWLEALIFQLRAAVEAKARLTIALEKKDALERELRMVSIRVNLFEKILIPRAQTNIKKIKIFLGDQDLAAVSRAKAAKKKIEEKKVLG